MIGIYSMTEIDALNKSLNIIESTSEKNNKCTFSTYDTVNEWDEIIVENQYNQKLFAGITDSVDIDKAEGMSLRKINVTGYKKLFDRLRVNESYLEQDADVIITDMVANFTTGFTVNNVEATGIEIEKVLFNFALPSEVVTRIAKTIGYDWYIDFDKDLHFFAKQVEAAPKNITNSSTFHKDLTIEPDVSSLVNQVVIRGGTFTSDLQTYEAVADGVQTEFLLPDKPQDITVYVNNWNGSSYDGYVEKTLGILFEGETPTTEFVVNYNEKYIANGTFATLDDLDKIKVTYKYQAPVRVKRRNVTSIDAIKTQFPSLAADGIIEKVINDNNIDSRELAYQLANEELNAYSNAVVRGSFKTHENIFRAFQVIQINTDEYVGSAIITQITSRNVGGNQWEHKVSLATVLYDFEDFLREILAQQKVVLIDNEIVETLYNFEDDITLSDTVTITVDQNRQTEVMEISDSDFQELNKSIDYVLGPYFPSSFADTQRVFNLDGGLLS